MLVRSPLRWVAFATLAVLGLGFLAPGHAPAQDATPWKAGAARVEITPQQLMWMSGYGSRDKPAEGKQQSLWAKALVIEDAKGHRLALITMDLVGIPRDLSVAVCTEVAARHKLPRESVCLATSHTHCGPVVGNNLGAMFFYDQTQAKLVAAYENRLRQDLVAVVGAALADLAPAHLAWGQGHVTFAVNRRTNREPEVPAMRAVGQLKGPVDHDAPVLTVRTPAGKLRAIVFGYACHATVLSFYQWCGDYPGYAQAALEEANPGAMALFWAGCGADQNPLPRRTVEIARTYGNSLAQGVQSVLEAPMTPLRGVFQAAYQEIELPFDDLPSRDKLLKDAESKDRYLAQRAKLLLAEMQAKGSLRKSYPYPVQTWALGDDLLFVTLGGEVVVDYSLRLKRELGRTQTWVAGYCNDVMAYIPSLRVLKEGGYEGGGAMVYYGLPTVWAPSVEERIVAAVHSQVKKIRGK